MCFGKMHFISSYFFRIAILIDKLFVKIFSFCHSQTGGITGGLVFFYVSHGKKMD